MGFRGFDCGELSERPAVLRITGPQKSHRDTWIFQVTAAKVYTTDVMRRSPAERELPDRLEFDHGSFRGGDRQGKGIDRRASYP